MPDIQTTLDLVKGWWDSLTPVQQNNNLPARGTIGGALVVLESLKQEYILDIAHYRAERGESQLRGVGKSAVQGILAAFGETRPFLKEGGRTNRGLAGDVSRLLLVLQSAGLDRIPVGARNDILTEVQKFLVSKVGEYFNRERIKFVYNPANTAWQSVHDILVAAKEVGKEGPVAQYLVGAKLSIRFPNIEIRNDFSSTQDEISGSPGDFVVNDAAFHVTVAPNQGHYDKSCRNVESGLTVYLLVPDRALIGTRQNAEIICPGRITTQSIESFVSQNLDELSEFLRDEFGGGFRRLLEKYNERVDQIENDKSMLIEIPRNLQNQ